MTIAAVPQPAGPVQLTTFIGREREIAAVDQLLRSARLITLTGVGGAGKTRLAAEVAARVAARFESSGWVDLASLSDPALVPQVVAATLGFREEGDRSAVETMVHRMCERVTFVILDNCEHLIDACAEVAEILLRGCPSVRILATSREALGVPGEQAWLVPPLSRPHRESAAEVLGSEAGRLFLERARAVMPAFSIDDTNAPAVAHICRRLDGIPLAIELAAARVRVLAPQQIVDRLGDSFRLLRGSARSGVARHRTLRQTIDWSHALLDPAEAALFRGLSVFAGTFSLDAVEAICRGDGVLDVLSSLVDKSLVVMEASAGDARYRLLETLRQYGHDRLADAGEVADLRRRHAEFFTELVAARERDAFGGAGDREWTGRLIAEERNLRAAGDWAQEAEDFTTSLRLCAALHWHWYACGHYRDGWKRLQAALTHADRVQPLHAGKAYAAAATLAFALGAFEQIQPHASRAVALLRDQNDAWELSYALSLLGLSMLGLSTFEPPAAEPLLDEATALARAHAPRSVLLSFALYCHGRLAWEQGDLDEAERRLGEGHAIGRALARPAAIAHPLTMLGRLKVQRGRLDAAARDLREALRIHADSQDALGCFWSLEGLARLAHLTGRPDRAAQILAGVREQREQIGAAWSAQEKEELDALAAPSTSRSPLTLSELVAYALESSPGPASPMGVPSPVLPPPAVTHTLTVRALGPLQISRQAVFLTWTSAKPRELLLFLLCHPDGRTRDQVGLAFWPDASADQVRNNFHVMLHRLRKTLGGTHWVTVTNDQYAVDPRALLDFDAARFERDVTAGLAELKKDGDATRLEGALTLYRGDFLEHEVVGDWHLELRDRLRQKYVAALVVLGERRMQQERWADAADAWRRLVARDDLDERAYRGLMTCHAKLGERSQVQQLYQRVERLLKKQLEAKPEPETVQLYRRLVSP
jgi:predicted ATPase/DNA-binding SARP family transcriptional activator